MAEAGQSKPITAIDRLTFSDACRVVVDRLEGGAKLIRDQGGLTKFGVSERAHPDVDIANLTREQAADIYWARYWKPIRGNALPRALALAVFDAAVNLGPERAIKILQGLLRVPIDGVMGPETVGAAKLFIPQSELVARYLGARLAYYEQLASDNPSRHAASLHGWTLRLYRLALEVGRWQALA